MTQCESKYDSTYHGIKRCARDPHDDNFHISSVEDELPLDTYQWYTEHEMRQPNGQET